jgi:anti-sigma regulatory factor (Ser/Thr protein kinase)
VTSPSVLEADPISTRFRHEALLYDSERDFLEGTLSFIQEGLTAREPVLVVLAEAKNDLLRTRLGRDADKVQFADMLAIGANPARIIPAWRDYAIRSTDGGHPFRGIGEPIWAGRSADELVECQRHEALLNLAFAHTRGFRLLCPYDATALTPDVLDEAHRSHPVIVDGPYERTSGMYREIDDVAAPFDSPLPEPAHVLAEMPIEAETLVSLRRLVAHHAADAGLSRPKAEELAFAANELATNSLVHGGGGGTLRLWRQAPALVCEVRDAGRIVDPLAGRFPPPEGAHGGRGLWLATQLCDLVQIRAFANGGIVRLHMRPS